MKKITISLALIISIVSVKAQLNTTLVDQMARKGYHNYTTGGERYNESQGNTKRVPQKVYTFKKKEEGIPSLFFGKWAVTSKGRMDKSYYYRVTSKGINRIDLIHGLDYDTPLEFAYIDGMIFVRENGVGFALVPYKQGCLFICTLDEKGNPRADGNTIERFK